MGLFSALGSLVGGSKQKKASRKAEAALIAAYEKGIAEQNRQFDQTREDYAPARNLLAPSVSGLADLVGVNGVDAQALGLDAVRNSPIMAALLRSGEEGIIQNASATGGLRGGDTQRSLADFRADTFSNELQSQMQRLAGLTGIGMGATDSVANFGANKANALTNLFAQQGGARYDGLLTRGGITAAMYNNAGNFLDKAASSFMPSTGFGAKLGKIF